MKTQKCKIPTQKYNNDSNRKHLCNSRMETKDPERTDNGKPLANKLMREEREKCMVADNASTQDMG